MFRFIFQGLLLISAAILVVDAVVIIGIGIFGKRCQYNIATGLLQESFH